MEIIDWIQLFPNKRAERECKIKHFNHPLPFNLNFLIKQCCTFITYGVICFIFIIIINHLRCYVCILCLRPFY